LRHGRFSATDLSQMIRLFVTLLALGALFYLPFIANFRSQLAAFCPI
jgi:hypothetical protein